MLKITAHLPKTINWMVVGQHSIEDNKYYNSQLSAEYGGTAIIENYKILQIICKMVLKKISASNQPFLFWHNQS